MKQEREKQVKRGGRQLGRISLLMLIFTLMLSFTALAAESGWKQKGKNTYYYLQSEEEALNGKKAKGLQKIGKKYYYFNKSGVLQTGWVSTEDGYRYFRPTGGLGTKGTMYTGFKTIGKYKYNFEKNGVVSVGFTKLKNNTYYFNTSKTLGTRGRAITKKWKTVKGEKYYFGATGAMAKNCWVGNVYYVNKEGKILKNVVTPDRYLVGSDGKKVGKTKVNGWVKINKKWHYYDVSKKKLLTSCWKKINGNYFYLDADGIRVTGWKNIGKYRYHFTSKGVKQTGLQTISGKKYYFDKNGRMLKDTTVDGYKIDADGIVVAEENTGNGGSEKPRILIIAGHGQGDGGAASKWGNEYTFTRQFAKLIYDNLKSSGKVDATYYKNGSVSYDCYQQNAKTLPPRGFGRSNLSGTGTKKKALLSAIKTNPNIPVYTDYDYVLEIHFNATAASAKDPNGNGSYKGVSFYVDSNKKKYTLENNIVSRIVKLGFKKFSLGVHPTSGLYNPRICQELGVSYGLLETAFIDDGDDMRFYTNNKNKMAKAVSDAIIAYYAG